MRRWISPKNLLRLAAELAGEGAGPGSPRDTDLRRATSTAYYALFHRLALDTVVQVLPGATDEELASLARQVEHRAIKSVCEWIGGDTPPAHLTSVISRLRGNPEVTAVAQTFVALQERREEADYLHNAEFNRPATLALVRAGQRAVNRAWSLQGADETYQSFLGLIAWRSSLR